VDWGGEGVDDFGSEAYQMEGFGISDVELSGSSVGPSGESEFLLKGRPGNI
jgi:hypothetical protein